MANRHILYKLLPFLQGGYVADAESVEVDAAAFNGNLSPTNTDVQSVATALDDLSLTPGGTNPNRFGGAVVPFIEPVTVDASNYDTWVDSIALYVAPNDRLVAFNLPSTEVINGRYPVTISILHQGGTARDAGTTINPLNRVRVPDPDADGNGLIRPPSTNLQFFDVRQNDFSVFTRTAADQPWQVHNATLTTGALLLPNGLFNLKPETVRFPPSLPFITGIPTGFTPQAGDAYRVGQDDPNFGGYGVQVDDVIVALVNNPDRRTTATNDDWLVIRNATNQSITLQELRFLNEVTEVDTFSDSRLVGRSDVQNVRVFLSTGILDHAPFINPSTDPDNPQNDGVSYVGGDEKDGASFEFQDTENHPNALVYLDIDGGFDVETNEADVFLVLKDRDGAQVNRYSLEDHFRSAVLPGSGDTYYILDHFPDQADNYSSINYINGYTIDVVYRATERQFNLGSNINVLTSIADGEIPSTKLEPNAQALLNADHSLTDAQQAKLDGLHATGTPTDWTAGELLVKLDAAHPTNDLNSYVNVDQINGILGNFGHTTAVTFLVPKFVNVTGLQRSDDTSVKLSVTPIGTILGRQGFTATLPASTFDINNPVGDSWIVDGTASNLNLSGADPTFKIEQSNLSDPLVAWIRSLIPAGQSPAALPESLQQLLTHMTLNSETSTDWVAVSPSPIRATLTREFAALWDENRRTFQGNYFQDITGVDILGFAANTIFYYNDANDPLNTAFPGAQSYIENDNIRFRNESGQTPIADSFRKVFGFNYALQRALITSDNPDMVRAGTGRTPLLALAHDEGLYLNIGRGDGGQQSRTYRQQLEVDGSQWGTRVDQSTLTEAEVIIPSSASGSYDLEVNFDAFNNDNDEGNSTHAITIANVGADQTLSQITATVVGSGGTFSVTMDVVYEHNNTDLQTSRRVLFLRPTQPFTNAAIHWVVSASVEVTETWNHPSTYARYPVNAGSGHDDFGLFDPTLWDTEQVTERNRVVFVLQKYRETDTSADPELAITIVVDGQAENGGRPIRLHRPASDFVLNDWSFGNSICAVSHVQGYAYTGTPPSAAEIMTLYNSANNWFNAFYAPGHRVETIRFDTNIEISAGHGLILTDADTGNRVIMEVDDGEVTFTNVQS